MPIYFLVAIKLINNLDFFKLFNKNYNLMTYNKGSYLSFPIDYYHVLITHLQIVNSLFFC